MSKTISIIFIVVAIGLIAYNVTLVNFADPFEKNSTIALIGIMASLCAIVLLLVFITSKKIQDKVNKD
ncbi:hypothetical protein [Maribacter stanieri]|uniref:Uncharacterized protein n=1 Tax=Maribacter stanieri TaxID=440514 RepID=A0A1I6HZM5_9FLAO|nr:hypothetical protein [Maribacter stanieri]SFR59859.1 hypothetical protein SAMN04488010_0943 [Maribacter stanieri]|tara:strand:- start:2752 stop:2955 length:204 start_codon:yes stop_codon:yes gene_type:complete